MRTWTPLPLKPLFWAWGLKKRRRKKSGYKVGPCGPPAACPEGDSRNIPEWKERAFLLYSTRPLLVAKNAGTCVKSHPILCLQLELSTCKTVQKLSILPCRRTQLRGWRGFICWRDLMFVQGRKHFLLKMGHMDSQSPHYIHVSNLLPVFFFFSLTNRWYPWKWLHICFHASPCPSLWNFRRVAKHFTVVTEKPGVLASVSPSFYRWGDLL